jgi:sRNA-binding regulator protein Hfq
MANSPHIPATGLSGFHQPRSLRNRAFNLHEDAPILAHQNMTGTNAAYENSQAEAFYFQKQVQAQTPMIIVLEDGEQIEGCIEWFDRNAIKVRSSSRTLIYKAAIKYIHKAGDHHA